MRPTGTDPEKTGATSTGTPIDGTPTVPDRFKEPHEVLAASDLDRDQKREILEVWRLDAARLADSTAEGMAGGEPALLRNVELALAELEDER